MFMPKNIIHVQNYLSGAAELGAQGAQFHTQILTIFISFQEKKDFENWTRFDQVRVCAPSFKQLPPPLFDM